MRSVNHSFTVPTQRKVQVIDLTESLSDGLARSEVTDGFVHLFCLHTTAGLLVNEYQSALIHDLIGFLGRFVDEARAYRHNDPAYSDCDRRNAPAHLRSLLLQPGLVLPIADGRIQIGRYQRVLLTELDGPRERRLSARFVGFSGAMKPASAAV